MRLPLFFFAGVTGTHVKLEAKFGVNLILLNFVGDFPGNCLPPLLGVATGGRFDRRSIFYKR